MSTTLVMIFFISAVILVFAQEFGQFIRKLTEFTAIQLLVPLAFASLLIELNDDWVSWFLLYTQVKLNDLMQNIADILPFQTGSLYLIKILFLFFLACLPTSIFWLYTKRCKLDNMSVKSYYFSALLWILVALMLIMQPM